MAYDPRDRAIKHATGPKVTDVLEVLGQTWPARAVSDLISAARGATEASLGHGRPWLPSDYPELTDQVIENTTGFTGDMARGGLTKAIVESVFSPSKDVRIGVFAGPRAANAPIPALIDAFKMKQGGATPEEIWKNRGWFELPDKNWAWEMSDDLFKLKPNPAGGARYGSEAFEHPTLLEGYPDLRNLMVTRESAPASGFSMSANKLYEDPHIRLPVTYGSGRIDIPPEPQPLSLSPRWTAVEGGADFGVRNDPATLALHELQHQVQDREGWVSGSNPTAIDKQLAAALDIELSRAQITGDTDTLRRMDRLRKSVQGLSDEQVSEILFRLYERNLGEMMSRAVESRRHLTPLERREQPPWLDFDYGIEQAIVPR